MQAPCCHAVLCTWLVWLPLSRSRHERRLHGVHGMASAVRVVSSALPLTFPCSGLQDCCSEDCRPNGACGVRRGAADACGAERGARAAAGCAGGQLRQRLRGPRRVCRRAGMTRRCTSLPARRGAVLQGRRSQGLCQYLFDCQVPNDDYCQLVYGTGAPERCCDGCVAVAHLDGSYS